MSSIQSISAEEALERLIQGNKKYMESDVSSGDISRAVRLSTYMKGQSPYAVIITCSDSRVIPESIFSAGIGELFIIRAAGNVIGGHELGSIEYAAEHLGCRLAVVMGHTGCGAVSAALAGEAAGYIRLITDEISLAAGGEKDPYRAGCLNVSAGIGRIVQSLGTRVCGEGGLKVIGAMYHTDTGFAEFLR